MSVITSDNELITKWADLETKGEPNLTSFACIWLQGIEVC